MQLIAHRGASAYELENTLEAFELARAQQADGIEFDVQRTRDGELVVFHDEDLKRLANRSERIEASTWDTLRNVWLVEDHRNRRVPRLDAVLDSFANWSGTLHLELKCERHNWHMNTDTLGHHLKRRGHNDNIVVSSFYPQALALFRVRTQNKVRTAQLFEATPTGLTIAKIAARLGHYALHPQAVMVTPRRMHAWRNQRVNAWTVDDPNIAKLLVQLGASGLITNDILRIRAAFARPAHAQPAQSSAKQK